MTTPSPSLAAGWALDVSMPTTRARYAERLVTDGLLSREDADEMRISYRSSLEHGKVVVESKGSLRRGLEVVELACSMPALYKGTTLRNVGGGVDYETHRFPLGVCAGITPFNFPAMIPMWMFGMACAAGNAFILKPSERDPSVPVRLAELFLEAGAPEGLLQVVHGDKEMVDAILDHEDIAAVSFVGSSDIAHYVYNRGVAAGKRVQAMGGASGPISARTASMMGMPCRNSPTLEAWIQRQPSTSGAAASRPASPPIASTVVIGLSSDVETAISS